MSKSYRSDYDSRAPSRFLTAKEEYERGLRRRPRTFKEFEEDDDDDDLVETNQQIVDDEE